MFILLNLNLVKTNTSRHIIKMINVQIKANFILLVFNKIIIMKVKINI